ncbi:MAG: OmpH family outer membrane protein [Verrucomicrobia bacterium]|nr:OmpH family outer membrane protein [Verrucomicrobiota bacterium]MBU4246792.1 OmpH family outer membrane protein [Verrucomicrobiota bacterium]MBU4290574.1 OmpH family outer membrane protein [Verrucomicrobiota bacterium]MBU4496598.1 OmpH family outer membrane protein [Verrucomicrobiota bacterium]MCG2681210.1 OmpH family outer membrane protein [Kiritimatiellia bacterium]
MSKYAAVILFSGLIFLPGIQPAASATDLKIAVISMERVFDEYHKTQEANAQFKSRADDMDLKRRDLLDQVKSRKSELETLSAETRDKSLSDTEREKKKQLEEEKYTQVRDAEEKLMAFDKACKKQFGDQMRQLQQQIIVEIRGVIQSYAKDHGITLVLDNSGKTMNNVESVIVADRSLDITDAVIAILNKDKPAPSAKPESIPGK